MEKRLHAVILSGSGEATKARARELTAAILCEGAGERPCGTCRHCRKVFRGDFPGIHPDVALVERTVNASGKLRREITVDQIRALGWTPWCSPTRRRPRFTSSRRRTP